MHQNIQTIDISSIILSYLVKSEMQEYLSKLSVTIPELILQ